MSLLAPFTIETLLIILVVKYEQILEGTFGSATVTGQGERKVLIFRKKNKTDQGGILGEAMT